ncbi:MAG TPA: single-stranded DNA-binding protein [Isosphaeraceae bacterium]|jgi:single-strand DNA-binding protein|nr:single-stranded DNA-binding protein [Isosphaeraceae bacterium]
MADLNKVFLIGRLTQDPELRYTPNGAAVTDLRVATTRSFTTKDGDKKEDTLFIDVTVWNRQAENCCQYLKKGRQVHVEGYLRSESWETPTGEKRTKVKVEADRVQFLDRRDDAGGGGGSDAVATEDEYAAPAREPRRAAPAASGASRSNAGGSQAPVKRPTADPAAGDDDIPF